MTESADLNRLRAEYARRATLNTNSQRYSLFDRATLFALQQRERNVLELVHNHHREPLDAINVLEVGCGGGGVLLEWLRYGVQPRQLHGCDLLHDRLIASQQRLPYLPLVNADGQRLPYRTATYDLVLQFTAFSSVLDAAIKTNVANEMLRVLKPNGMILWYDFWLNPTNRQTRGIRPNEIRTLFPYCQYEFHRITLAPPLARRLVPISWQFSALLEKLALFNTHYLVAIRPCSTPSIDDGIVPT